MEANKDYLAVLAYLFSIFAINAVLGLVFFTAVLFHPLPINDANSPVNSDSIYRLKVYGIFTLCYSLLGMMVTLLLQRIGSKQMVGKEPKPSKTTTERKHMNIKWRASLPLIATIAWVTANYAPSEWNAEPIAGFMFVMAIALMVIHAVRVGVTASFWVGVASVVTWFATKAWKNRKDDNGKVD